MSQPPCFALHVTEDTESDGQEPSPDNEGALHTSFHQLIQEQSSLVEAGLELEMQARGRGEALRLQVGWDRDSMCAQGQLLSQTLPEPKHIQEPADTFGSAGSRVDLPLGTQRASLEKGMLWRSAHWSGAAGTGAMGAPVLTALRPAFPLPEHPALLAPPDACATACLEPEQGEQQLSYSSASLRILANMPSRTIGRSRGAIISKYYNRTARLRRRSSRPPLQQLCHAARPSLRQYDLETDPARATLEDKQSLLVKELLSLSPSQRGHMLLTVPLSLAEKRTLRQELSGQRGLLRQCTQHRASFSPCGWSKDYVVLCCRGLWYRLLSLLAAVQPWRYALKQISGRFGSSVLSYFLFLKTLLMFNIISFLILLVFVVALQAAYPPASASPQPFTSLELLTGAGYFTHSLLYYGYYSNATLNNPCTSSPNSSACPLTDPPLPYNMPLAYVFSIGVCFLITCILLVYSMSHSFGESYRVGSSTGDLAVKVFCAWDFKVIQKRSVKLQCENICTQLKELLAEQRSHSHSLSLCQRLRHSAVLLLAWALSLSTVLGCVLAVFYFSEHMHVVQQNQQAQGSSKQQKEAILLVLPLVVSLLNMLMPHLYNLLAMWEKQDSPVAQVYVAICRNLILKMVVLGLLCYQWLSRKVVCSMEECWETCVGQDLYRFVVMDFIFTLLDMLFGELVWRLILEKRLKRKQRPEFDIARNVLELIYGQTLTWLGVLFAPLLPAVQTLKLLLLFYIKKTSLMQNCQSPSKPWQASHMSTIFITLLCFPSFLGAAIFLSYTIWSVQPSETCGPFQGLETIYKSGKTWVQVLEKSNPNITWLAWVLQHLVENPFLLFFVSGVLLAVTYFNIQVVRGQQRIMRLLKEQIANEGEDKVFLIQKLHSIYEQRGRHA